MARQRGATFTRQQIETIIEPRRDFLRRQDFEPRGSQFDRQRDAVQARTNLRGGRGVFHQPPICRNRHRALDEKLNRIVLSELCERRDTRGVGEREGWHAPNRFAADIQRLAAGRQNLQLGTRAQQRAHQLRARAEQMLAVVNDEQQFLRAQVIRQHGDQRHSRRFAQVKYHCDRLRHERGIAQRGKVNPPPAVLEAIFRREFGRHPNRETRLAASARAG